MGVKRYSITITQEEIDHNQTRDRLEDFLQSRMRAAEIDNKRLIEVGSTLRLVVEEEEQPCTS